MNAEDTTAEQKLPELRIRGTKDIFDALVSDDFGKRLSIARAIAANPVKASSYGPHDGMELIDFLIHLLNNNTDSSYRPVLLVALASFNDPRILELFMAEMAESEDALLIMAAAARLAIEKDKKVRRFMSGMLRRNAATIQARMAANIMAGYKGIKSWNSSSTEYINN